MAKLYNIVFCLSAKNNDGQSVNAEHILSVLNPEYIPGLYSFSVISTVHDLDTTIEHSFRAIFKSPKGDNVVDINSMLQPNPNADTSNIPDEYKGLNIAMDWNNVDLKISGLYKYCIYIDNVLLGEKEIFVRGKNE